MSLRGLAASPLGFVIGLSLGALGGGGSILAVPALVFVAGLAPAAATSASLVVVGIASSIGAYGHWRRNRVRVGPGVVFGLVGIGGAIGGSVLNRRLDGDVLLLAFAALILVAAWRIVVGCPSCTRVGEQQALRQEPEGGPPGRLGRVHTGQIVKVVAVGSAVGFLTGLFGVGGGFVIVPALALVLRFPMPEAVGTSLLVIVINTVVAFLARLGSGTIDWGVTAAFAFAATAGVLAGTRLADRLDPRALQRGFAALLVGVAAYTGGSALAGLL